MAKKKGGRHSEKEPQRPAECDLDGDYRFPVQSLKDLTLANIRAGIIGSRYAQALLLLTIIGLFLRFYNLGFNSLWLDEASTYTISVNSFSQIWQATAAGEFNPPLFYWMEHVMLTFGNSEAILRFIPAVVGTLTIPLIYCVGKEFMDRTVGIIAAAAFAFSPFLIYYSQEARAYIMMLFFVVFAMLFYLKALKDNGIRNWVLFGLFSALALWAHFYAFAIIASLILYALAIQFLNVRQNLRKIGMVALSAVVFSIACLPLFIVALPLFASRTALGPTFGVQGFDVIYQTFLQIAGFNEFVMYLLLLLFIAGIIQTFLVDRTKGWFLVSLTILPFVISIFLSYRIPMVPRYLIFFAAVFFIGVAVSYRLVYSLVNSKGIIYGFLLLMVILNAPVLAGYYSGYSKADWRGFSAQMQQTAKPGDFIVLVPGYIAQPFDYYYTNRTSGTIEFGATTAKNLDAIAAQKANNTIYYIVTTDIYSANPSGDALAWIKNNTKAIGQDTTGSIALFVSR
jgi:4-amino-4-deoxy-L-arabinose transferase-like glycosyltransferase